MKKSNVLLVMSCLLGMMSPSCVKENGRPKTSPQKSSTATAIKKAGAGLKTVADFSGSYVLNAKAGHTAAECNNACRMLGGKPCHVSCQGFGSCCETRANIAVCKVEPDNPDNEFYKGCGLNDYEPTDEATYSMPARSYYIIDESLENGYIYLNIPSQILERNAESGQFMYVNISFTENPLFENF